MRIIMTLGMRLRQLRLEHGLSLEKAAPLFGIHFTTLAGYERDEREPEYEKLKEIAQFYNVSIDWLLGNTDKREVDESSISKASILKEWVEGVAFMRRAGSSLTEEEKRQLLDLAETFVRMVESRRQKKS